MPSTPNLLLPYPALADTADVPRDIQALATRLDVVAGGAAVSALPGSPTDGQEVYYVASAALGVVWHLRYRAAAAGASKWEFVGGSALSDYVAALSTFSTTAYGNPATGPVGPTVTLPLAGEYEVTHAATLAASGAGIAAVQSYSIGAAAAADTESIWQGNQQPLSTGNYYSVASPARRHVVAAGTILATRYRASVAGTCNAQYRGLRAVPVRVG